MAVLPLSGWSGLRLRQFNRCRNYWSFEAERSMYSQGSGYLPETFRLQFSKRQFTPSLAGAASGSLSAAGDDAEGLGLAGGVVFDGDVFAHDEAVEFEPENGFVVVFSGFVGEAPTAVRHAGEPAVAVFLPRLVAGDGGAAGFCGHGVFIKSAVWREGQVHHVGVGGVAFRLAFRAPLFKPKHGPCHRASPSVGAGARAVGPSAAREAGHKLDMGGPEELGHRPQALEPVASVEK